MDRKELAEGFDSMEVDGMEVDGDDLTTMSAMTIKLSSMNVSL
jgi:hypothetical protein